MYDDVYTWISLCVSFSCLFSFVSFARYFVMVGIFCVIGGDVMVRFGWVIRYDDRW